MLPIDRTESGTTFSHSIRVGFLAPEDFRVRMLNLLGQVKEVPRVPGVERILVPGQLEAEHEAQARINGLELDSITWERLQALAVATSTREELARARSTGNGTDPVATTPPIRPATSVD